jgi:toxin-antitoxin system PIN domain toxin
VIAVDTNIMVYAHRRDSPWCAAAQSAMRRLAEGSAPWALPWPCVHEFLAVVTHPRIYQPPSTMEQAFGQLQAWFESPTLVVLTETDAHLATLAELLSTARVVGPRVHDARVAALCVEHGVDELWTIDRDFSRFSTLKTRNPLARPP